MLAHLKEFMLDESGATLVEYGLVIALVALVAIAGLTALAGGLNGLFNKIAGSL
ncbi:MAG: Flp family type IVb pilin [Candidatus Eremiobacteraeota bacterium]|nr:Flp family type IVb pilin [Candidatus Eremiobacteraeota bacterium]